MIELCEQIKNKFFQVNSVHTAPTIVDGDFKLWESRAIMTYLCNQYAPDSSLYPKDPKERASVDRWLQFDLGTLDKSITEYTVSTNLTRFLF